MPHRLSGRGAKLWRPQPDRLLFALQHKKKRLKVNEVQPCAGAWQRALTLFSAQSGGIVAKKAHGSWGIPSGSKGASGCLDVQIGREGGVFLDEAESQFGLGADARLFNKKLELNLDAYDTSDPQVDLLAKYIFGKGFYVQGGYRNIFNNDQDNGRPADAYPVIGAGKRF